MKPTDTATATRSAQRGWAFGALTGLPEHHCGTGDGLGLGTTGSRLVSETRKFFLETRKIMSGITEQSIAFQARRNRVELKASGCHDIADAYMALAGHTATPSRPQVPKEVRDDQARSEYRWLADQGGE